MAAISFQEGLRKLSFTIRRWLNDNAIINKGTLINNFDLNDFTNTGSSGYYFLSETNSYINAPNNFSKEGILINFVNSDNFYQLILDLDNCFYIRTKNNNIWFSWKNYNVSTFEEQILNINEFIGNVEEPKETSIIKKIEKIEENSKELEKKVEKLEYVSKGVLYKDVTNEGIAKSVTITNDVLPYGAISMIGGASYTRARNCIPFPYDIGTGSYFINGIRRTIYSHAMIEYHGTATKDVNDWLFIKANGWNPGKHKFLLSGCYPGGSDDTYYLQVALFETASSTVPLLLVRDYGDGAVVDASDLEYECMSLSFVIKAGVSIDDTVKPQLEIGDRTEFEPYTLKHIPIKRLTRINGATSFNPEKVSESQCTCSIDNTNKSIKLTVNNKATWLSIDIMPPVASVSGTSEKYTLFLKILDHNSVIRNYQSSIGTKKVGANTISSSKKFSDINHNGVLIYPFSISSGRCLSIYIDLTEQLYPGEVITLGFDIRNGNVSSAPDNVFEPSVKTIVFENPSELIDDCPDYGVGVDTLDEYGNAQYNYIDYENRIYHRRVMVTNNISAPILSDGVNAIEENVRNPKEYPISSHIDDDMLIIPMSKDDIFIFETADGETPIPVPYKFKYQVKI